MEEEDIGDDQGSSSVAASTISSGATGAGGGTDGDSLLPPVLLGYERLGEGGSCEMAATTGGLGLITALWKKQKSSNEGGSSGSGSDSTPPGLCSL